MLLIYLVFCVVVFGGESVVFIFLVFCVVVFGGAVVLIFLVFCVVVFGGAVVLIFLVFCVVNKTERHQPHLVRCSGIIKLRDTNPI